jgi:hypothetical protein
MPENNESKGILQTYKDMYTKIEAGILDNIKTTVSRRLVDRIENENLI